MVLLNQATLWKVNLFSAYHSIASSVLAAWNENQGKWPNKTAGSLRLHESISFPSLPAYYLYHNIFAYLSCKSFARGTGLAVVRASNTSFSMYLITGSFLAYRELNQVSTQPKAHLCSGGCTRSFTNAGGNIPGQWFFLYCLRIIAMSSWQIQKFHKSDLESDLSSLPSRYF